MDDLLLRFAALADDTEQVRHIRGTALAVAMDWLIRLPEGKVKDLAIEQLGEVADLACSAYSN